MSWGAQNRSKDAKTPSVAGGRLLVTRSHPFLQLLVLADTRLSAQRQFWFSGHCQTYTGSNSLLRPVLSSPAHGTSSLAMEQI